MSKFPRFPSDSHCLVHVLPELRFSPELNENEFKKIDKYINKELTIISNTSHHVLVPLL